MRTVETGINLLQQNEASDKQTSGSEQHHGERQFRDHQERTKALTAHRVGVAAIFPFNRYSVWRVLQQAANRTGVNIKKAHPHAFRHRAGRKWAKQGTIAEVAAMMGHANIATTMKYARLERDVDLSRKFLE
jgi:site-specific recombinase XerD